MHAYSIPERRSSFVFQDRLEPPPVQFMIFLKEDVSSRVSGCVLPSPKRMSRWSTVPASRVEAVHLRKRMEGMDSDHGHDPKKAMEMVV